MENNVIKDYYEEMKAYCALFPVSCLLKSGAESIDVTKTGRIQHGKDLLFDD